MDPHHTEKNVSRRRKWGLGVESLAKRTKCQDPECLHVKSGTLKILRLCLLFKSSLTPEKMSYKASFFFSIKFI